MGIDPCGPTLISHRSSDGARIAKQLAVGLRGSGVPVWLDADDLPPGDIDGRLREALDAGLSGGVLVVTEDLAHSSVVRELEFPGLREMAKDERFFLVIANAIPNLDHVLGIDLDAPDRLLRLEKGALLGFKQYPVDTALARARIAHELARERMKRQRALGVTTLVVDIETRERPRAMNSGSGLVVRTLPPPLGQRCLPREAWVALSPFLDSLPDLVAESGARDVEIRGGAHLSAAFALGAALPRTSRWPLSVIDRDGRRWESRSTGPSVPLAQKKKRGKQPGLPIAVLVDLVPGAAGSDSFGSWLVEHPDRFSCSLRITCGAARLIDAEEGAMTAAEVSRLVRDFAARYGTTRVDLFLRTPFPIAVLLGRTMNTFTVHLHEWEDGLPAAAYRPVLVVASGRGGGPVVRIPENDDDEDIMEEHQSGNPSTPI